MITPSNSNNIRVTGPLCGEFTGQRWIPLPKASDTELWCFFDLHLINGWVKNREAGDLRRYRGHYDVTVMQTVFFQMANEISQNLATLQVFKSTCHKPRFMDFTILQENATGKAMVIHKKHRMKRNLICLSTEYRFDIPTIVGNFPHQTFHISSVLGLIRINPRTLFWYHGLVEYKRKPRRCLRCV